MMTPAAKRVLAEALDQLPQLPQDPAGWQHYMTGMGDSGSGVFGFDHAVTGVTLNVETTAQGIAPTFSRS